MAGDAFNGVIVLSLSDSGETKPKCENAVVLKTSYDPNGISITIQSGIQCVSRILNDQLYLKVTCVSTIHQSYIYTVFRVLMIQFRFVWIVDDGKDLFEFPVTHTSDCSKVGKKGYLFEFDSETLLFTFKNDTGLFISSKVILSKLLVNEYFHLRFIQVPQVNKTDANGQRSISIYREDRRLISFPIFPILCIFISAAEHDARLHSYQYLSTGYFI